MPILEYDITTGMLFVAIVAVLLAGYLLKGKREPPGPFGIPILGYLPFLGSHPPKKYFELSKKYGSIISVKLGPETFTVLNDYESIYKAFVRNAKHLSGRPQNGFTKKFCGGRGYALHDYNDDLKTQRKFCLKTLKGFGVGKTSIEEKVMTEIGYFLDEIDASKEEPISCRNLLACAASNIINNVILGSRYSYQDKDYQELVRAINQDFSTDKLNSICFNLLVLAPSLRYIPPFSRVFKILMDGRKLIADTLRKVVDDHREKLDRDHPRDFIDEFLVEMEKEDQEHSSFCESQLYEAVSDLFFGGTETTSSTLGFCFLALAHCPNIQSKVHEEIIRVIGHGKPSMNHKNKSPYLNAFIQELTRHSPLLPVAVPHRATEDVPINGYVIPKSRLVQANIWAVHHDPKNFKCPDDFIPERFIDKEGSFVHDERIIPFSLGPRICLGEQLAKAELFLFLACTVQRFEIRAHKSAPLPSLNDGIVGAFIVPKDYKVSFVPR